MRSFRKVIDQSILAYHCYSLYGLIWRCAIQYTSEFSNNSIENEKCNLQRPPGMNIMTHHQIFSMVAWWNTWRNVTWFIFFRRIIKTVSISSIALEKKYHHKTFDTCHSTRNWTCTIIICPETVQNTSIQMQMQYRSFIHSLRLI